MLSVQGKARLLILRGVVVILGRGMFEAMVNEGMLQEGPRMASMEIFPDLKMTKKVSFCSFTREQVLVMVGFYLGRGAPSLSSLFTLFPGSLSSRHAFQTWKCQNRMTMNIDEKL